MPETEFDSVNVRAWRKCRGTYPSIGIVFEMMSGGVNLSYRCLRGMQEALEFIY
jgi:hypothetical protein